MKEFQGKVIAITGGATGIGFSFAKRFGEEGAKIAIAGRRKKRVDDAVNALKKLGIEAKGFECDVAKRKDVEKFADRAWKAFGSVDVIVNNAGITIPPGSVLDIPSEDAEKIFSINFWGVWHGSAVFGKRFIEQGTPAAIYNIGSENSLFNGVPFASAYVATKHAVLAMTEALREELPDFVDVALVCPGFVTSELGDPEVMAHGMDTDKYTKLAMEQIKNEEFYVVSHAYNMVRINERHDALTKAYEKYAPRYEGDEEFDIRTLARIRMEQQS